MLATTPHYASKMNGADLYSFDSASSSTAADIVQSTYNKLNSTNPFAEYAVDAPLLPPATSSHYRPPTSAFGGPIQQPDGGRPMTAVKGAGYNGNKPPIPSSSSSSASIFDPLGLSSTPAPPLAPRTITSPELQCKELEKQIHALLEESAAALHSATATSQPRALEKAKEAVKRERALCKQREKYSLLDTQNHDLTYAILFNLAHTYHRCGLHAEALSTYAVLLKNKNYPQAQRLRVNIGNVHYMQGDYQQAVKCYRMCIDHLSGLGMKELRARVMNNIAVCFLKLGQYQDAIHTLEAIMDAQVVDRTLKDAAPSPSKGGAGGGTGGGGGGGGGALSVGGGDIQTGFNLIVCYYALGDKDKMKKGYSALLTLEDVRELQEEGEEEEEEEMDDLVKPGGGKPDSSHASLLSYQDDLAIARKERHAVTQRYLVLAGRLIAPCIEATVAAGFDWVIEELRKPKVGLGINSAAPGYGGFASHHLSDLDASKPGYPVSAMQLLLAKGISYLHGNNLQAAIEVFRSFHHQHQSTATSSTSTSSTLIDHAATNLSFLYFLECDSAMSEQYAELALRHDRYNAKALVNKANLLFSASDYGNAKELYLEAIGVEADCVEAIYNLGLVNRRMGQLQDAAQAFRKLHRLVPDDRGVAYQLGAVYEALGDVDSALHFYHNLASATPTDPALLAHLAALYHAMGDETNAYHHYADAFHLYPIEVSVLSWLGVWCVKNEMWDDALTYFEYADQAEGGGAGGEVKWRLMMASCYRRMGEKEKARRMYERVHAQDEQCGEAVKYLVAMAKEEGREGEVERWTAVLRKMEKGGGGGGGRVEVRVEEEVRGGAGGRSEGVGRGADGAKGLSVSPAGSPKAAKVDASFKHELGPEEKRQTINQGRGAGDEGDEWGDEGLGDDLLPL